MIKTVGRFRVHVGDDYTWVTIDDGVQYSLSEDEVRDLKYVCELILWMREEKK